MEIQGIAKVITANPEGIPCVWARFYDIPSWSSKKKDSDWNKVAQAVQQAILA